MKVLVVVNGDEEGENIERVLVMTEEEFKKLEEKLKRRGLHMKEECGMYIYMNYRSKGFSQHFTTGRWVYVYDLKEIKENAERFSAWIENLLLKDLGVLDERC